MVRILLVEDDQDLRSTIQNVLSKQNYLVSLANNGKEGQHMLLSHEYDVVISDVQMPEMDGLALLKWCKAYKPTPFILMTGYSDKLDTQTVFQLNADNFIMKPFEGLDLLHAIREVLTDVAA